MKTGNRNLIVALAFLALSTLISQPYTAFAQVTMLASRGRLANGMSRFVEVKPQNEQAILPPNQP